MRRISAFCTLFVSISSILALHASFSLSPLSAAGIDLTNTVIVQASSPTVVHYAAQELQKHLQLVNGGTPIDIITGTPTPGKFPIYVGIRPVEHDSNATYATEEEARWVITGTAVWLYGFDRNSGSGTVADIALNTDSRTGSLWAVYEFLENHAGIRWIEPGDNGIIYTLKPTLTPPDGTGSWVPQLIQRRMRFAYGNNFYDPNITNGNIPPGLTFSSAEFQQRQRDEQVWQRRHRRGESVNLSYGHAFTSWWNWYNETNGAFVDLRNNNLFAMLANGRREPASAGSPDRIKLCVSNPDTAKRVAHYHFYRNTTTPRNMGTYSVTNNNYRVNSIENDSRNFCNCADCKALDVVLPGEENLAVDDRHLTDRYVHFINRVHEEVRNLFLEICANPGGATGYDPANVDKFQIYFYAYSRYNLVPRRETVNPNIFLFLLPNLGTPLAELNDYFRGWSDKGANVVFHRPNDLNQDTGMPMGFEYHMFEKNRLCNTHLSLKGADYDICYGFWPTSGIANYVMMRALYRPEVSFVQWENEYFSTFGDASADIREYYTYWRQIWNERIMNNLEKINAMTEAKDVDTLRAKVTHLTDQIYSENDFDRTDVMITTALTRSGLTAHQRARIENLKLSNQHNRLTYRAARDNCFGSPTTNEAQKKASSQTLLEFRIENRLNLNINWVNLSWLENYQHLDSTGIQRYLNNEPSARTPVRLRIDNDVRLARQRTSFADRPAITSLSPISVNVGDTVTIRGNHFYDIDSIQFGGVSATTWTRVNATTITAVIPAGVPDDGIVSVITSSADRADSDMKYYIILPVPHSITAISPAIVNVGDTLTITGERLRDINSIQIGGVNVDTWALIDENTLTLVVPDGVPQSGAITIVARGISITSDVRYNLTLPITTVRPLTDQTVGIGRDITFTADTDGHIAPACVWEVRTSPDGDWTVVTDGGKYSGATTKILRITGLEESMFGYHYRVTITNGFDGPITSNAARVNVQPDNRYPHPVGVVVDTAYNVYIADNALRTVQRITSNGVLVPYAGSAGAPGTTDGTGTDARFVSPAALSIAPGSQLVIADNEAGSLRLASPLTNISTLAIGLASDAIATDISGNIYVADTAANCIHVVTLSGIVTTIAGSPAGESGFLDGTGTAARFNKPAGIAVASNGTIYVADSGNHVIRAISPGSRTVSTIAGLPGDDNYADGDALAEAGFSSPRALALKDNILYIADTGNSLIRKLDLATSTVGTFAGYLGAVPTHGYQAATGTYAVFDHPQGLAFDQVGRLYVADTGNALIRRISSDGNVTMIAPIVSTTGTSGSGNNGGGGGGGVVSLWYLAAAFVLALARLARRATA